MSLCLIITGGAECSVPPVYISKASYVIACDRGYLWAKKQGIKADLVLGDFDSYCGTIEDCVEVKKLPCKKDDTDTHYAVKHALLMGYTEIVIACAFGGRLDHTLSNIQTARFIASNPHCNAILIGQSETMYVFSDTYISLQKKEGWCFSVFSLSDKSTGVCIEGAKYNVQDVSLVNSFPIGQSNEYIEDFVTISVETGALCVIETKQ